MNNTKRAVIVHTATWQREDKVYGSLGVAKGAMKRSKKRSGAPKYPESDYRAMTFQDWVDGDYMVETTNLLNPGSVVMIKRSEKGTFMDPATERYHCM